jgi:cytidylate kinase
LKSIIIAIDGFSGCGKSTLAKALAAKLNYRYIDTGAMYRAVTLYFLENSVDIENPEEIAEALKHITIAFKHNEETNQTDTFLNGEDREIAIRSLKVANLVSPVSAISSVRKFLVHQQKQMGNHRELVMDGRDIGTVVFPDAELKIFMNANDEIRIQRRLDEMQSKGLLGNYDDVAANLKTRDLIDSTREDSPLKKADDAIEIDNSNLTREEQFEIVYKMALEKINSPATELRNLEN